MSTPKRRRDGTWEEPEALKRIRESFTEQKIRAEFERLRGRPPHSDGELQTWFEFYMLELYNNGHDAPK